MVQLRLLARTLERVKEAKWGLLMAQSLVHRLVRPERASGKFGCYCQVCGGKRVKEMVNNEKREQHLMTIRWNPSSQILTCTLETGPMLHSWPRHIHYLQQGKAGLQLAAGRSGWGLRHCKLPLVLPLQLFLPLEQLEGKCYFHQLRPLPCCLVLG